MRRSHDAISFRRSRSRGLAAVVPCIPLRPLSILPVCHVRPGTCGCGGPDQYGRPPGRGPLGHAPDPAVLLLDYPAAGGPAASVRRGKGTATAGRVRAPAALPHHAGVLHRPTGGRPAGLSAPPPAATPRVVCAGL